MKTIDIISVGEVLIDFIGHEFNASLEDTNNYHRFLGGSPTNVAVNTSRLGLNSLLVATCGKDGLGDFIYNQLKKSHVNVSSLTQVESLPTSIIMVSKSKTTPDFIPYRSADYHITESQLSDAVISSAKIFHTTCFALSKEPARTTILEKAKKAKQLGLKLSIDINFSERIWNNREEAKQILANYLNNNPLVKLSDDDCLRLFNENKSEEFIFDYFHNLGASTICLTKGASGVVVSDVNEGIIRKKGLEISEIKDATGAGDAFWTGFLYGNIHQMSIDESLDIAQKLAKVKLQHLGGSPKNLNIKELILD